MLLSERKEIAFKLSKHKVTPWPGCPIAHLHSLGYRIAKYEKLSCLDVFNVIDAV